VLAPEDLIPLERVDAVVSGDAIGLELAEELARLEPCGAGNPAVTLLVPAARCTDPRPMGDEGRHLRFTVEAGGSRARAVSFGCDGKLPVNAGSSCDLTFRLELREWRGAVEPRLVLRDARPCEPPVIEVLGTEEGGEEYVAAALAAATAPTPLAAAPSAAAAPLALLGPDPAAAREIVDRRGAGAAGVLVDLVASGEPVLAVVADVPRRLEGLRARLGGFALCDWAALAARPGLAAPYRHVVALDPPALAPPDLPGAGCLHLVWGDEERAFAERMLLLEHDLRVPLAALFRALRDGTPLVGALRGPGAHPRSPVQAGRLLRILLELELVDVDPAAGRVTVGDGEKTDLDRSPTFRAAQRRLAEGRRHLAGEDPASPSAAPPRAA
jgi:single-stranded-DNA-specific exonuclease